MIHLMLNSGKCHENSRPRLLPSVTEAVTPFLKAGKGSFPAPFDAYSVESETAPTGLAFTLLREGHVISASVGTWEPEASEEYWDQIEGEYRLVSKEFPKLFWALREPTRPDGPSWLATLLLPHYFLGTAEDKNAVYFLNTCEVVLFWAAEDMARRANENN